jgi:hypothetical protein
MTFNPILVRISESLLYMYFPGFAQSAAKYVIPESIKRAINSWQNLNNFPEFSLSLEGVKTILFNHVACGS